MADVADEQPSVAASNSEADVVEADAAAADVAAEVRLGFGFGGWLVSSVNGDS